MFLLLLLKQLDEFDNETIDQGETITVLLYYRVDMFVIDDREGVD